MPTHHGKEGSVDIDSNQVAELRSFSFTETAEVNQDTSMGDEYHTHKPGLKAWSGQLTCWWDEDDTNGQGALRAGASVTLNMYEEGNASGDVYHTGLATITEYSINQVLDGIVEATFSFTGNGPLTQTVVA